MAIALVASTVVAPGPTGGDTSSIDTTGATLLVAVISDYAVVPLGTLSDSKGNTWTPRTNYNDGAVNRVRTYYAENPTVGTGHVFTYSSQSSLYPAINILAFSGTKTASVYDTENGANATQAGSVTPSEDNEVLVAGMCRGGGGPYSIDSGFTISGQVSYGPAVNLGGAAAYKIQTTAGAENPAWDDTGEANIATFKAAASSARAPYYETMLAGAV